MWLNSNSVPSTALDVWHSGRWRWTARRRRQLILKTDWHRFLWYLLIPSISLLSFIRNNNYQQFYRLKEDNINNLMIEQAVDGWIWNKSQKSEEAEKRTWDQIFWWTWRSRTSEEKFLCVWLESSTNLLLVCIYHSSWIMMVPRRKKEKQNMNDCLSFTLYIKPNSKKIISTSLKFLKFFPWKIIQVVSLPPFPVRSFPFTPPSFVCHFNPFIDDPREGRKYTSNKRQEPYLSHQEL